MAVKTIAGPFKTRKDAEETAQALGANCSIYGRERRDSDGYGTGIDDWYVEQDDTIFSGKIFGYDADEFMRKQYK